MGLTGNPLERVEFEGPAPLFAPQEDNPPAEPVAVPAEEDREKVGAGER